MLRFLPGSSLPLGTCPPLMTEIRHPPSPEAIKSEFYYFLHDGVGELEVKSYLNTNYMQYISDGIF